MKTILGTMTFGEQVDKANARQMIEIFLSAEHTDLDTAYIYCGGETEKILGQLITPERREEINLATKAHPSENEGLSPHGVTRQLEASLARLKTEYVDLFYLHSPDPSTPITDTLQACWRLHQSGKFKDFGLSNYAAWQVSEIYHICAQNGWMKPVVYQGMYNALTRDVERELFPCLRSYGIKFYAYNPLAGGLLTGKHPGFSETAEAGRFKLQQTYRDRYWDELYFQAVAKVVKACNMYETAPANAALRWLTYHSCLSRRDGDGIILGASKVEQLERNLGILNEGSLEQEVVEAFDRGWEICRSACSKYFRP